MGDVPTTGQLLLLIAAIAVLFAASIAARLRRRLDPAGPDARSAASLRLFAKVGQYVGVCLALGVLIWHCAERGVWQPLEDNFGAFLCLGILLCLFVIYTQRAHPLRGLDLFIMPVVLLFLILAAVFGKTLPHEYRDTTWSVIHVTSANAGFLAFAVAGALGGMYLIANRRLRLKQIQPGQGFGSLERLEHLTLVSVTLGFALLTVGLVTGLFRVLGNGASAMGPMWYRNPKVVLTFVAWGVYALVLHSPINPAFRGRRTALLSVIGFVLMIGVFVAVQFVR